MKPTLVALLATTLPMLLGAFAHGEGNERGNGGDEYAKEFIDQGYEVLASLVKDPIAGVDTKALLLAIQKTKVNSQDSLTLRGNVVDAINYPDPENPRILISRTSWDRMKSAQHRRAFLALHEYLGILGVDDSTYAISSQLDRANVCERNAVARKGIENASRKLCYRITYEDLHFLGIGESLSWGGVDDYGVVPAPLAASDFFGLDQLFALRFNARVTSVEPGIFDNTPRLVSFAMTAPSELPQFHEHRRLGSLSLGNSARGRDDPSFVKTAADSAFANLSALTQLELAYDPSTVAIDRVLQGATSLEGLSLMVPSNFDIPSTVRALRNLSPRAQFQAEIPEGQPRNLLRAALEQAGYTCESEYFLRCRKK